MIRSQREKYRVLQAVTEKRNVSTSNSCFGSQTGYLDIDVLQAENNLELAN